MDTIHLDVWDKTGDPRELAQNGIEVWLPVHISPDRYFVSNLGNIASKVRGLGYRQLNKTLTNAGRYTVSIYVNKGDKHADTWLVYRLMLWAFDGPPPSPQHTDACHGINGETDDRLCNMRWGTRQENMQDVALHKREKVKDRRKIERVKTWSWYEGDLFDDHLVQKGLELFDKKLIGLSGLAVLWECSEDLAGRIVNGKTQLVSDEVILLALEKYVEHKWSCREFAEFAGLRHSTAEAILSGRNRVYLAKPEGFMYPWPDAATMRKRRGDQHGNAKVNENKLVECFERIMRGEFVSVKDVQTFIGLSRTPTYRILNGTLWAHVPRPAGFDAAVRLLFKR